jgi:hypothetical protein
MDDQQLLSFDAEPAYEVVTVKAQFERFHSRHPEVYAEFVRLCRVATRAGRKRVGIKQLFEVLRWNRYVGPDHLEDYKLNNNYAPHYARLIMSREPDLANIFETRAMFKD